MPARDALHQPAHLTNQGASGDARMMRGTPMPELQAQHIPALTSISTESTRNFDLALHVAAANSAESMTALRKCVCDCVENMKESGIGTVQMILTIKACAKGSALRYRPLGDEHPQSNVDLLLDEIVKWSIIEFYKTS